MQSFDVTILIAVLGSTFTILAVMISLFLWLRSEANNDRRDVYHIQREDKKDLLQIARNLELTMQAIQNEMKDFHNRLCIIEERSKK